MVKKIFEDRFKEIKIIYIKLQELGISEDVCQNLKKFKSLANEFVKNGLSLSGTISLDEINKNLIYIFSQQSHILSTIILREK